MNYKIPWNQYALITELADRMKNSDFQFGKTALVKLIYLLQTVYGVKCGYTFTLYTYGPYSVDIIMDLGQVEGLHGVKVEPVLSIYGGYQINPGDKPEWLKERGKEFLKDEETVEALDQLIEEYGNRSAADLSLITTAIYVDRELSKEDLQLSKEDIINLVHSIKSNFSEEYIAKIVNELDDMGYILSGRD